MERRLAVPSLILLIFLLMISILIPSCDDGSPQEINFTGTIQHIDLQGGFYAIRADDNTYYDPTNLESRYQVQDLRVHVTAIVRDDIANIHMFGQLIDIKTITEL